MTQRKPKLDQNLSILHAKSTEEEHRKKAMGWEQSCLGMNFLCLLDQAPGLIKASKPRQS